MMYAVPFEPRHFRALLPQPAQLAQAAGVSDATLAGMAGPYSHTLMLDGQPIACVGAAPLWPGRAYVWSFLSTVPVQLFRQVHTWALRYLDALPYRRLEAAVEIGFAAGERWVRLLGFVQECPLARAFAQDGADCSLYARVRP
jgi:hypothetical protein